MCTPVWTSFSSTCAPFVVFFRYWRKWSAYQLFAGCKDLQCENSAVLYLGHGIFFLLESMLFIILLECHWMSLHGLCLWKLLYNFQQRISWLSHRWRTQRNAISNVNCRIQWIIESLNASCAPWYSEEHACLSVIIFSTLQYFVVKESLDCGGLLAPYLGSAPLKCISGTVCDLPQVW